VVVVVAGVISVGHYDEDVYGEEVHRYSAGVFGNAVWSITGEATPKSTMVDSSIAAGRRKREDHGG